MVACTIPVFANTDLPPEGDPADIEVVFKVALADDIFGDEVDDGSEVRCTLQSDITVDERVIAPAGSKVIAHVNVPTDSNGKESHIRSGRLRQRRALLLHFDKIITPEKDELNISGAAIPQKTIFNNAGTFRQLKIGAKGEVLSAQDIELVQAQELGLALPKEFVDHKNFFNVNLKQGDELRILATVNPSFNLSGKILKSASTKRQSTH